MAWLGEQWRTLRMRLRRDRHDQELADEMAHHLELRAARLRERGLSAEEAHRMATRRFGNVTLQRERSRDLWGWPRLETFSQDIRYALRVNWKRPAFALLVVLTMALGIGANTAVFALLQGLLLRVPPVARPDRLVMMFSGQQGGNPYRRLSYLNYLDVRKQARTLSALAAFSWPVPLDLSRDGIGPAERVWAQVVTGNFFDALGVPASMGRTFAVDEDLARNTHLVAIVSAIREEVSAIDSRLPVINATTLQAHVDRTLVQSRVFALLATLFGVVAVLLASVGIYGMLSLMIRSRTREIGIRVAFGAPPNQIVRMVARPGVIFAAVGLATGALIGGWISRALAPMLYGRTVFDPATLLLVAALLASMILSATFLPARRALRVDPAAVLRQE